MPKIPQLPIIAWIDQLVEYLRVHAQWFFNPIAQGLDFFVSNLASALEAVPPWAFIILALGLTYFLTKKKGLVLFTFLGLAYILNLGYWQDTMLTLALILTASFFTILIGIPLGILMAKKETANKILTPILDFMQTMPAFVYLIPAVSFFGIGMVPGIIASIIFSMPPVTRLTNLGIRQVDPELIEAADAFGATSREKLHKVEFPMAKKTIMQGVNQSIMLALSMVVIASMIGADGLGTQVYQAITRNNAGEGFAAGLGIVVLAILLDRMVQGLNQSEGKEPGKKKIRGKWGYGLAVLLFVLVFFVQPFLGSKRSKSTTPLKIIGIEPGAGVMQAGQRAIEDYDLPVELQATSSAVMTQSLSDAIKDHKEIVVTGWSPHWKFQKFDLKYLEDPKKSFGEEETINTIVRKGLKEDKPNAYKVLDQFAWTVEDMETVMLDISEGMEAPEAAKKWIGENQNKVEAWMEGIDENAKESIELAYVAWDTEIASTNVLKAAMEDHGFTVNITQVDAGPMWNAVAGSKTDGMVCAWLPFTQKEYYDDFKDEIVDLGPNLKGAKIGLVVPAYSKLEKIEDLKN